MSDLFDRTAAAMGGPPEGRRVFPARAATVAASALVHIWCTSGAHNTGTLGVLADTHGQVKVQVRGTFRVIAAGQQSAPINLAKVGVAGSNPVVRSKKVPSRGPLRGPLLFP